MNKEERHEVFVRGLLDSHKYVEYTAAKLFGNPEYRVEIAPPPEEPPLEWSPDQSDGGDLHLRVPVEVKHNETAEFTCRADFPYPEVIFDGVDQFDRKNPSPWLYIIWSKGMECCIIVPCIAKMHFRKKKVWFKNIEKHVECYAIDLQYVEFYTFKNREAPLMANQTTEEFMNEYNSHAKA